ncbi:hypothetical protein MtrunA17_Chr2g0285691 [Medicago truncatula]|nr:hypothetical protein MtrunA17_Chr2g0285691 [Medicago truncatula]
MKHLGDRYALENVHGLTWAMIIWFLVGALSIAYFEYREKQQARDRIFGRGNWVLGNEEDDSIDLLSPTIPLSTNKESQASARMEVQLEPLNR